MLNIIKHPLIEIKLTKMRDKETDHYMFRTYLSEIASLMTYEILRDYKGVDVKVLTPTGAMAKGLAYDDKIVVVPILRAGLGMVDGILNMVPNAHVGHIGMYRNEETFMPETYYYKMPEVSKSSLVILVDPMLATGNSAADSVAKLKEDGFTKIVFVGLVGCPEGVKHLQNTHPDVKIFLAAQDEKLNENKYIIPGLGDAGDRIFGTK